METVSGNEQPTLNDNSFELYYGGFDESFHPSDTDNNDCHLSQLQQYLVENVTWKIILQIVQVCTLVQLETMCNKSSL